MQNFMIGFMVVYRSFVWFEVGLGLGLDGWEVFYFL